MIRCVLFAIATLLAHWILSWLRIGDSRGRIVCHTYHRTPLTLVACLRSPVKADASTPPVCVPVGVQVDGPFVDGELQGMSGRDLLNHVITKAAKYNILVMLDLHRLNDQFIPQLWYSEEHSVDDVLKGWDTVLGTSNHP